MSAASCVPKGESQQERLSVTLRGSLEGRSVHVSGHGSTLLKRARLLLLHTNPLKFPSACWQGCVSTLLSHHRDYSRSPGSQLGDSG